MMMQFNVEPRQFGTSLTNMVQCNVEQCLPQSQNIVKNINGPSKNVDIDMSNAGDRSPKRFRQCVSSNLNNVDVDGDICIPETQSQQQKQTQKQNINVEHMPLAQEQEQEQVEAEAVSVSPVLSPWDIADANNDQCVVPYVDDIVHGLRLSETQSLGSKSDYVKRERGRGSTINYRMRTILVDWLISVHRKFQLSTPALYLCVDTLDRYLSIKENVSQNRLQLIGSAALWIASKYSDCYAPEAYDFVYSSSNAFTAQDLIDCELDILSTLSFNITVATPLPFAQRFIKIATFDLRRKNKIHESEIVESLVYYLIEHCMIGYQETHTFQPSLVAAASVAFAILGCNVYSEWPSFLADATGYTMADLLPVIKALDVLTRTANHTSLKRKYSSVERKFVGKMNFAQLNLGKVLENQMPSL